LLLFLRELQSGVLARVFWLFVVAFFVLNVSAFGQAQDAGLADAKRVTVSQNNDGSRTTYEIDGANRKEVATTIGEDGKVKSKILYDLDENGRFAKGQVYGPGDQLRFKTAYKYDGSGRLMEETQLTKDDVLKNRLVYSYDALSGRQTGYTVYDAAGKVIGQPKTPGNASQSAPPPEKKRR
jgi:YD repeat-containing protein